MHAPPNKIGSSLSTALAMLPGFLSKPLSMFPAIGQHAKVVSKTSCVERGALRLVSLEVPRLRVGWHGVQVRSIRIPQVARDASLSM